MSDVLVVGIIGGFGGMGRLFAGVFERAGHKVLISGRNTCPSNSDLAGVCDVVIVSVPIHETVKVIEEIAPLMNSDQILCDFTSVKLEPVKAMLKSEAKVIGLHPMFGPSVSGIKGQTIVATPVRCDRKSEEMLYQIFRNEGADVCIMTPEEHDRITGIVQGLVHFATLSVADTIRNSGISPEAILPVMSPVYRIEMGLIGRILGQDAALYGDILQMNPASETVIENFCKSAGKLKDIVKSKDRKLFESFFNENEKAFHDYIPQATKDTDTVIEALVK
ncbi:prephenate dehydrogenase/arogenate dehydrogenase family protein [Methanoplanus sp. FWC-SCC4]|uniref:Prephenate dehydrogenase/arogenate dehydrogenase family protein n=2 Tax=Methanochimaera problematica TaxID=2609417 RepID=A0AA97I5F6_9EURY|nr:prephenate dehydrogenase/arogenate dehydrogenase family protein [Methanoplanus sp. FWC-SCC4]